MKKKSKGGYGGSQEAPHRGRGKPDKGTEHSMNKRSGLGAQPKCSSGKSGSGTK